MLNQFWELCIIKTARCEYICKSFIVEKQASILSDTVLSKILLSNARFSISNAILKSIGYTYGLKSCIAFNLIGTNIQIHASTASKADALEAVAKYNAINGE